MTSPQPPGHFIHAHFLMSPLSTIVRLPASIIDRSDRAEARVVRKSNRSRRSRRNRCEMMFFMSAHHVQKRLLICPTKCCWLVATGVIRLRLNKRSALFPGVKASHARSYQSGLSSEPGHSGQPLIDCHRRRFGREGDDSRGRITFAQNVSFFFQPLICSGIIAPHCFFARSARIDVAAAKQAGVPRHECRNAGEEIICFVGPSLHRKSHVDHRDAVEPREAIEKQPSGVVIRATKDHIARF